MGSQPPAGFNGYLDRFFLSAKLGTPDGFGAG